MHPKLQTLNHFDGKKDQFNFQTFIFDSFWDTVLKYCQIFKKKKKEKDLKVGHWSIFQKHILKSIWYVKQK